MAVMGFPVILGVVGSTSWAKWDWDQGAGVSARRGSVGELDMGVLGRVWPRGDTGGVEGPACEDTEDVEDERRLHL